MAKLPKVPKSVPKPPKFPPRALPRAPPSPKAFPSKPQPSIPSPSKPAIPEPPAYKKPPAGESPLSGVQRVWSERPRLRDLKPLPEEELRSARHTMRIRRWRQWPMYMCGLAAFGIGLYGAQLYISLSRGPQPENIPYDLSDRFDKEADGYDEKVSMAETLLLLNRRRKQMTKRVKGHVLEVAVGTGRNIPYYPTKQCATVTLLDSSAPMLAVSKRKWKDTHPEYFNRVFFKQQSALDPITPPFDAQDGYDTVLQTMGLCSTPEPVKLLHSLEAATKEDGGQILLLEHGRSHFQWLNNLLDKTAPSHADLHGCWWNKDIGKIVEESGLEVVHIRRYNFGTTWWVHLRPRKGMRKKHAEAVVNEKPPVPPASESPVARRSRWSLWV